MKDKTILETLISRLRDSLTIFNTIGLIWLAYEVSQDHQAINHLFHNVIEVNQIIGDIYDNLFQTYRYINDIFDLL